jgi:hypothetical protein
MCEDLFFWFYMVKRDAVAGSFTSSWEFRLFTILTLIQTGVLLATVSLGSADPLKVEVRIPLPYLALLVVRTKGETDLSSVRLGRGFSS